MKTLQWITVGVLSTTLFMACNNAETTDNRMEDGHDGMMKTDNEGMSERDRLFSDWDADRNDGISREEFDRSYRDESFDAWDANRDGILDDNEYRDGLFGLYDRDRSGRLNDDERNTIWDDKPGADIADWDRDGNKEMDREEFRQIFSMKNDFKDWDENGDGKLDKTEYTKRMYRRMDANNDGIISKQEFNNAEMN